MKSERAVKIILFLSSFIIILIASGMMLSLINGSIPVFKEFGLRFIVSPEWNPTEGKEDYGALAFITGTVLTSVIAIILCFPLAFSTSLFLGEYYNGTRLARITGTLVDMLAGIPSIVYGLWGFYVLRPLVAGLGLNAQGFGVFTAGVVLAIMIIPYATSITTEIIKMVPNDLKEAAYSLGATRRDVILDVIVPNARSGIFTSYVLAFGRALGETMAVTMLIGNANVIPKGIFGSGNTMASVIANQFGEASGLKLSALIAIGLLLFLITGIINGIGKLIIKRFNV
jgi:phosphate transport system permease protein